jgi:hypothetical protein
MSPTNQHSPGTRIIADVKCYYCGHVGGQMISRRNQPLKATDFVPRAGYKGEIPRPGARLRCERCLGPVFLEDAGSAIVPTPAVDLALARRLSARKKAA